MINGTNYTFLEASGVIIGNSWIFLKIPIYIFLGYMASQIIEYLLDRFVKKFRFDKWILYVFFVKTPYVSSKVSLKTKQRPNINEIKSKIENSFRDDGFDKNELKPNNYLFKIRGHPTPVKIWFMEPDEENFFTLVIETFGDDKLSKFSKSSLIKTIQILETIVNNSKDYELTNINTKIKIDYMIPSEELITYNYQKNIELNSKNIITNTKHFTKIMPMVKDALSEWRVQFL